MKLDIKTPEIPSLILLLPTFFCFFTDSLYVLATSSLIYVIGIVFTKHRLKKAAIIFSVLFLSVFGGIFFITGEENFQLILLRWIVTIYGILFFYFQYGYTGILRIIKSLHLPKLLQIAFWSAIRSIELLFPAVNKGIVLLRNENISFLSSPIRYIGSMIVLLVNMADSLTKEMEMTLTLRKHDYFSIAQESTEWNVSGIIVITLTTLVSLLMIFTRSFY